MFLLRRILSPRVRLPRIAQPPKSLHTSPTIATKLFVDNENRYAHRILQSHANYFVVRKQDTPDHIPPPVAPASLDFLATRHWPDTSDDQLLADFAQIAQFCGAQQLCISDTQFDSFVDELCRRCFHVSDAHLLVALRQLAHLPETPSLNTRNFLELWNALDDACCDRILEWPVSQILLVCDHWYLMNLGKVNKFNWNAAKKLGRKIRKLPPAQLVQTMFYTNLLRSPVVEMIDFEMRLRQCVDQLSLDEIAVMCMGFFKTQTQLKSVELMDELYARLQRELATVGDISFVNVMKMLRYSSRIVHVPAMRRLLDGVEGQVARLSLMSCLHVMLLGSDLLVMHERTLELCLRRFEAAPIADIRLKDMERIAFVLGLYNYRSDSGVADTLSLRFLAELKCRVPEIMRHPRCLPACLQFLCYRGFADAELIATVLDEGYCKHAYGKNVMLGRELFALDSYAKIDLRDSYAQGTYLAEKRRRQMGILLVHYIPQRDGGHKLTKTDQILLEIKEAVEKAFGACRLAHVLPHYDRPDVILAYDRSTGRAVDIADRFPRQYYGGITWRSELLGEQPAAADPNIVLCNLIVGGWNNYVRDEPRLIGLLEQKRSQSVKIGYRPVVVPWFEWVRLTPEEQAIYAKQLVEQELRS